MKCQDAARRERSLMDRPVFRDQDAPSAVGCVQQLRRRKLWEAEMQESSFPIPAPCRTLLEERQGSPDLGQLASKLIVAHDG